MSDFGNRKIHCAVAFFLFLGIGCSSVPETATRSEEAELASNPKEFTGRIEASFRKKVAFFDDAGINAYLSSVANRIFAPGPNPIQVEVVSAAVAGLEPSVWALPNGKVFFDVRVLRAIRFENEIAAGITLAWGRSEGPEFRERMITEAGKGDPNLNAIWKFSEIEDHRAIESSIDRLYKGGYDPRGLVEFFERVPIKPKDDAAIAVRESNQDKARRTLSFYAPLLNPIVRTEDFYKMRKRLEKL